MAGEITPWMERAPPGDNLSGLQTRGVIPHPIEDVADFPSEMRVMEMAIGGVGSQRAGFFDPTEPVGRIYRLPNATPSGATRTSGGVSGGNQ